MVYRFIIIIVLIFTSCNLTGELYKYDWQIPVEINTIQEALDYMEIYNYVEKSGVFLPNEFYNKGYGDCEDFALMFQYIFETQLDIKANIIIGYYNNSNVMHAWVEIEDIIYEPTAGIENNYPELYNSIYRYEYPDSIYMVRTYGGFVD